MKKVTSKGNINFQYKNETTTELFILIVFVAIFVGLFTYIIVKKI